MGTYTRPAKATSGGGGTSVVDGNKWPASEINADFDGIVNVLNGNIDETNISPSAQIANSQLAEIAVTKVGDYSTDATTHLTTTSAGTTGTILAGTTSLPTDLSDELERIRYRLFANNHLVSAAFTDSSASQQSIGWVEAAPVEPQLFTNNGFETKTSAVAGDAPDTWTLEGTPTSLVITAPGLATPSAGVTKKALRITYRTTANEGLKQVLKGLKGSTKYIVGATYARVSGTPTVKIITTGALSSGDYQNLNVATATSGTAVSHFQGVFQTTAAGGDVTVKFVNGNNAADVVDYYQVWAYELKDSTNLGLPHIPMQTATILAESSGMTGYVAGGNTYRTDTLSSLTLAQYAPAAGYRFTYDVSVPVRAKTSTKENWITYGSIQLNTGGGASTVVGPVMNAVDVNSSNGQYGMTFNMKHVVENPTPGTTYTFSFLLGSYDSATSPDTVYAPLVNTLQTKATARLIVERL